MEPSRATVVLCPLGTEAGQESHTELQGLGQRRGKARGCRGRPEKPTPEHLVGPAGYPPHQADRPRTRRPSRRTEIGSGGRGETRGLSSPPHQACPARGSLSLSVPTARALLAPPWPRTHVLYPSPAGYFQESLKVTAPKSKLPSPCQASIIALPWPGPSPRLEGDGLLPRGLWNSPHPRSPSWPSQAFLV